MNVADFMRLSVKKVVLGKVHTCLQVRSISNYSPVAKSGKASGFEPEYRRFESYRDRQIGARLVKSESVTSKS